MTLTTARPANAAAGSRQATVKHLQAVLDGRWAEVRARIRARAADPRFHPLPPEASLAEMRRHTTERVKLAALEPYPRAGLPRELGGTDDPGASVTAVEMLGHGDLSLFVKAGVQFGLWGGAIVNLGTGRHHAEYVESMLDCSLLGCFAMTETGHGSNLQALETTATHDPATDELIVHSPTPSSRKDYIGGAAVDARIAAVFAQLITADGAGHGVHCILVPIRDDNGNPLLGITIEDCGAKAGLPGVDNGRIGFDHVRVPRTNLLDRHGGIDDDGRYHSPITNPDRRFFTMIGTLVRGRVSVAAGAGAATRSALTMAVRHAMARKQFGIPGSGDELTLMTYPAHQRKLLPALAVSYALALAQNDLVERLDTLARAGAAATEADLRTLESRAAGLKAVTTAHATATIQACREACGGAGYLAENRIAQLKADTDVFTTFEGDNTVLLQLLAKNLLVDLRRELGAGRLAQGAFAARSAAAALAQQLPAPLRSPRMPRPPRTRATHLALLRTRERELLRGTAMRLARAAGPDPAQAFDAFTATQNDLLALAEAHVHRGVLECFDRVVAAVSDPAAGALLDDVCALYALSVVERHRAWYLEHRHLTPAQGRAVVREVDRLCAALAPRAGLLVDAFAIPEPWTATPGLG